MKKPYFFLFFILLSISGFITANAQGKVATKSFNSIIIDTLWSDKIQIRAILMDENTLWYGADNGRFGCYDLNTNKKYESKIIKDTLRLEFRSIAQTKKYIYVLSVANPGLLYQISKENKEVKLVYQENGEKVFYDSMQFWNDKDGIAIGDPIEDCLAMIVTHDGGNSWQKIPCSQLPKVFEGEAAFAASNTNIVIKGNNTWIASGGKKSRIFYSPNMGKSWEVFDSPLVQGKEMTGIFSADFYNDTIGFVAGGNYEIPKQNFENKATTIDGGKTWQLIAENQGFGIASCVQYIPNSNGKELVSVGATGIYYSADSGLSWKQFSTYPYLFTLRFLDNHTAIGAGYKNVIRINFKK